MEEKKGKEKRKKKKRKRGEYDTGVWKEDRKKKKKSWYFESCEKMNKIIRIY